ncbi:hypothetical protein F5890DRAFT_816690 [Lentinula detonsa]|uniref:Uncharacterized protein n=1 Tax=Lentinula detonsa TaxID=2804962 RepID=A0AA38UQ73_9AGAR|nr:hypothetical protein F5890DRAFT_816690 [Lentinula detonsa]
MPWIHRRPLIAPLYRPRSRWVLNLLISVLGIGSTIAGYKNNTIPVTVVGAIAILGSFISFILTQSPGANRRRNSDADVETQVPMLHEMHPQAYAPHPIMSSSLIPETLPFSDLRISAYRDHNPSPYASTFQSPSASWSLHDIHSPPDTKSSLEDLQSDSSNSPIGSGNPRLLTLPIPFPYSAKSSHSYSRNPDSDAMSSMWDSLTLVDDIVDFESVLENGKPSILPDRRSDLSVLDWLDQ